MIILFLIITIFTLILFALSRGKYKDDVKRLDKKEYRLKEFIPIQMYLLELCRYSNKTKYNRKLYTKISELYGVKNALFFLKIHSANKLLFLNVGLIVLVLIGSFSQPDGGYAVFCFLILFGIYIFCDNEINKRLKARHLEIQIDFPDFLNKLTLLINAGMTMPGAIEKIVYDNRKESCFYKELRKTMFDIKSGMSEIKAYEDFAKRCRTTEITKFVSVVLQNLKRGSVEIVPILRLQSEVCWESRKNVAKKLGEEASTKLLLPMMIIFVAILIIVITPAILSMQGI